MSETDKAVILEAPKGRSNTIISTTPEKLPFSTRVFGCIKSRDPKWLQENFIAIMLLYFLWFPVPFYRRYHRSRIIYALFSHMLCLVLFVISIIIYVNSDVTTDVAVDVFYPILSYFVCAFCTSAVFCYSEESHINQLIVSKYPGIQESIMKKEDNIIEIPENLQQDMPSISRQETLDDIEELVDEPNSGGNNFPTHPRYVKKWISISYACAIPVSLILPILRIILSENGFGASNPSGAQVALVIISCVNSFFLLGWVMFIAIECVEYYILRYKMIQNFTEMTKEHKTKRDNLHFNMNTLRGIQEWYITRLRIQLFRRKRSLGAENLAGLGAVFIVGALIFFLIKTVRADSISIIFESVLSLRILFDICVLLFFFFFVSVIGARICSAQKQHTTILMILKTDAIADALNGDETADERIQMIDAMSNIIGLFEIQPEILGIALTPEFINGLLATLIALFSAYFSQLLTI